MRLVLTAKEPGKSKCSRDNKFLSCFHAGAFEFKFRDSFTRASVVYMFFHSKERGKLYFFFFFARHFDITMLRYCYSQVSTLVNVQSFGNKGSPDEF